MIPNYVLSAENISTHLTLTTGEIFNHHFITSNYEFSGNSYSLSPKIEIRPTPLCHEKHYVHSFEVWINRVNVGLLSTDCVLPQANPCAKLTFANAICYSTPGILFYIERLKEESDLIPAGNPSYFELPLDIQLRKPLMPRISEMERHSTLDKENQNPKFRPLRCKTVCSKLHNGTEYTFGHPAKSLKGTGKQIAIYRKSDGTADKGHKKQHITDRHAVNGLDLSKSVERIEPRISARWLADKGITVTLADLINPEALKLLFIAAVGDAFKFLEVTPKKKAKRNAQGNYQHEITDLFPTDFLQCKTVVFPKKEKTSKENEIPKRIMHKTLVHQFVRYGTLDTAAALQSFEVINTPPAGTNWPKLRHRYAYQFPGAPTPENNYRITFINALLTHDINVGVSNAK